jgi:hypothetical protein
MHVPGIDTEWHCVPALQLSVNIDRAVLWNEDARSRAITLPGGALQGFPVSLSARPVQHDF